MPVRTPPLFLRPPYFIVSWDFFMITTMITLSSTSHVPTPVLGIQALPHRILTMTLHGRTTMFSHFTSVEMEEAISIKTRPSFPLSQSLPSGSSISLLSHMPSYQSEDRQNENHSHRKLIKLITWTTALSNSPGCCFFFGSISLFFLELLLYWSLVAYWAPTDLWN